MTTKTIRWFEVPTNIPAGFHNPDLRSCVVCLNYKDHDDLTAGVEPWFLTHEIAVVTLISEWADPLWDQLTKGAQEMVDYAASDEEYGFKDGDLYGVYCVHREERGWARVHLGLAYADTKSPLIPITGMVEVSEHLTEHHRWVTPQFAIPLELEVRLPGEAPEVIR